MNSVERSQSLPDEMQGRWIIADQPKSELLIEGSMITCFDEIVSYDYMQIDREDGALMVSLKVADPAREDTFQRSNITGLVMTPGGDFLAYNAKFVSHFVRPGLESP